MNRLNRRLFFTCVGLGLVLLGVWALLLLRLHISSEGGERRCVLATIERITQESDERRVVAQQRQLDNEGLLSGRLTELEQRTSALAFVYFDSTTRVSDLVLPTCAFHILAHQGRTNGADPEHFTVRASGFETPGTNQVRIHKDCTVEVVGDANLRIAQETVDGYNQEVDMFLGVRRLRGSRETTQISVTTTANLRCAFQLHVEGRVRVRRGDILSMAVMATTPRVTVEIVQACFRVQELPVN